MAVLDSERVVWDSAMIFSDFQTVTLDSETTIADSKQLSGVLRRPLPILNGYENDSQRRAK